MAVINLAYGDLILTALRFGYHFYAAMSRSGLLFH